MISAAIIFVPLVIWTLFYSFFPKKIMGSAGNWEFDVNAEKYSFFYLADRFLGVAKWIGCASAIGTAGAFRQGNMNAAELFTASIALSVLFAISMLLFYEGYLHHKYTLSGASVGSGYTTWKYALVQAFGFSTIIIFILGLISLVQ